MKDPADERSGPKHALRFFTRAPKIDVARRVVTMIAPYDQLLLLRRQVYGGSFGENPRARALAKRIHVFAKEMESAAAALAREPNETPSLALADFYEFSKRHPAMLQVNRYDDDDDNDDDADADDDDVVVVVVVMMMMTMMVMMMMMVVMVMVMMMLMLQVTERITTCCVRIGDDDGNDDSPRGREDGNVLWED